MAAPRNIGRCKRAHPVRGAQNSHSPSIVLHLQCRLKKAAPHKAVLRNSSGQGPGPGAVELGDQDRHVISHPDCARLVSRKYLKLTFKSEVHVLRLRDLPNANVVAWPHLNRQLVLFGLREHRMLQPARKSISRKNALQHLTSGIPATSLRCHRAAEVLLLKQGLLPVRAMRNGLRGGQPRGEAGCRRPGREAAAAAGRPEDEAAGGGHRGRHGRASRGAEGRTEYRREAGAVPARSGRPAVPRGAGCARACGEAVHR
mmetsp:Transcript_129297/g.414484  ORF Transcript_129297/g.414484 Transcript_129297/m.414484 type:complete len:258 (+) Transcript_129297:73-846(+)